MVLNVELPTADTDLGPQVVVADLKLTWKRVASPASESSVCTHCTIASWNVLADSLVKSALNYPWITAPTALRWKHRSSLLLQCLRSFDADVLCLQEVDVCHFMSFWQAELRAGGYDGVVASEHAEHSVAIFWKRGAFESLGHRVVAFDDMVRHYSEAMSEAELREHGVKLQQLGTGRHGLIVGLRHTSGAGDMFVSTTHLWTSRQRNSRALRTLQLKSLLDALHAEATTVAGRTAGIVVCGDFNDSHDSPTYELLTRGSIPASRVSDLSSWPPCCHPADGFFQSPFATNLPSAYATVLGSEPRYATRGACIDFLHSSLPVTAVGAWHQDWVEMQIPNESFPSDHLPVLAQCRVDCRDTAQQAQQG